MATVLAIPGRGMYSEVISTICNIVPTIAIFVYTSHKKKNQRDIFTQEITPVAIGQTLAKIKLLIMTCITALTPII